jgi:hypothetical protein
MRVWLKFYDVRFDFLLLSMIDEVTAKHGIEPRGFLLFGFSRRLKFDGSPGSGDD